MVVSGKTHNQAQHYAAFGRRMLASSHRCARRYMLEGRIVYDLY